MEQVQADSLISLLFHLGGEKMTRKIKQTLMCKRAYETEQKYLLACVDNVNMPDCVRERLQYLSQRLSCVALWIELLSDDEAFVVEQHYVNGYDIPRIVEMYRAKWGTEYGKTERTIRSYQKRALEKIAAFEQRMDLMKIEMDKEMRA